MYFGRSSVTITAMAAIVKEGLEAGALGFSTTRTILHRAKDGELAPGTTADREEVIGIGRGFLGIPGASPRTLIGRAVTVGCKRVGVVPSGKEKITLWAKSH